MAVIRRGVTATPIAVDFEGQPQFLIDASVFPGSSGSPVLIVDQGSQTSKLGVMTLQSRILLLGVVAEVLARRDIGEIKMVSTATVKMPAAISRQMIDLGIVFKASAILQTVEEYTRLRS